MTKQRGIGVTFDHFTEPMIFHIHRREYDLMDWKGKQ